MNTVSNETSIATELKSSVLLFSYLGVLPFLYFAVCAWWPAVSLFDLDPIIIFRTYSAVILSFLAGSLWASGLFASQIQGKVQVRTRSLLWSGIILSLFTWGALFISAKAGLFVGAMLFLVVWQVEQKTELTRCYPAWYTELRAKLSMIVGALHILIWLTVS